MSTSPSRTVEQPTRRPARAARRFGYLIAAVIDLALIYAVLVRPGWQVLPFLTDRTRLVVPVVVASFVVGALLNVAWLVSDPRWFTSLGDTLNAAVAVLVGVRVWQVFPFDFGDTTAPWPLLARLFLGLCIAGAAIGVLVSLVRFARAVADVARKA